MRTRGRALASTVILALALPACLVFPTNDPFTTYREIRESIQEFNGDPDLPDITVTVQPAGNDAVDVFTTGSEERRIRIAQAAGRWLGERFATATTNVFDEGVASVALGRRLLQREGAALRMTFDTEPLLAEVQDQGYSGFNLIICKPMAETQLSSSRPPDFDACADGFGWIVDSRLTATMTLQPDAADYVRFIAAVALGLVVLGAFAWLIGNRLREGPFRRRTSSAVALGSIVGAAIAIGTALLAGGAAANLGPSDNLALSKDLSAGSYLLSAALPALAGLIPGVLFAVLLVKKRPWPEEPLQREPLSYPTPPPPPGSPGAPPPPPMPWGSR